MVSLCLFHALTSLLRLPPSFFVAFILHMEEGMQRIRTPHYLLSSPTPCSRTPCRSVQAPVRTAAYQFTMTLCGVTADVMI